MLLPCSCCFGVTWKSCSLLWVAPLLMLLLEWHIQASSLPPWQFPHPFFPISTTLSHFILAISFCSGSVLFLLCCKNKMKDSVSIPYYSSKHFSVARYIFWHLHTFSCIVSVSKIRLSLPQLSMAMLSHKHVHFSNPCWIPIPNHFFKWPVFCTKNTVRVLQSHQYLPYMHLH